MKSLFGHASRFAIVLGLSASCADSKFNSTPAKGSSLASADANEDAQETPEAAVEQQEAEPAKEPSQSIDLSTEEVSALDQCISKFGEHPFGDFEIANPHVVNISDSINNNSVIFTDSSVTDLPKLYLINFNINVGNNGILQFLNPKGWYCFHVNAKVINNFTIESAASDQVAIVSKFANNDKNFTILQKP